MMMMMMMMMMMTLMNFKGLKLFCQAFLEKKHHPSVSGLGSHHPRVSELKQMLETSPAARDASLNTRTLPFVLFEPQRAM